MNIEKIGDVYCDDERIVNPFGIGRTSLGLKLGKRDPTIEPIVKAVSQSLETVEAPEQSLENKTKTNYRNVITDLQKECEIDFIHCTILSCYINDLTGGSDAGITVNARLWEASLVSQDFSQLRLSIIGHVQPINSPTLIGSVTDHVTISTTIRHRATEHSGDLPPWAYGVVVVCSLLLITGTLIILRKIGFFKRPTKEKLREEKRQSEMCLDELEMADLDQKDNKDDSNVEMDI